MKLYYTLRSPYSRKVRVVALEKGISLELKLEDLKNKSEGLIKNNPVGKIPILELDSGESLVDSSLICEYLNDFKDTPILWPQDKKLKLRLQNLDYIAKGMTDVTVSIFYEKFLHPDNANQEFIKKQEETVVRCLKYFNKNVNDLMKLSIASISIACAIGYLKFRLGYLWQPKDYSELSAWYEGISMRPSMKETVPVE